MAITIEHQQPFIEVNKHEPGPYAAFLPTAYRSLDASTQTAMHRRGTEGLTATQVVHEPFDVEVVRDVMFNTAAFAFRLELNQEDLNRLADELFGEIPSGTVMSARNQKVLVRRAFIKLDPEKSRSAEALLAYADEPNGDSSLDYTVGDYYVDTITQNLEERLEGLMREALEKDPRLLQPSGYYSASPDGGIIFDAKLYEGSEALQAAASGIIAAGQALGLSKARTRTAYDKVKTRLQDQSAPEREQ